KPLSRAEIAERVNRLTGEEGRVKALSPVFLRLLGFFVPFIRAANDSSYQFNRPFLVDSDETERLLGVQATPWAESLAAVIESYRAPAERADA
ncbi:MAG TPA: hypothetical protein VLO31_00505, partial [Cryobacterium sp.]|nr:hypothetical protein [Cryobacterium sp.]